MRPARSSHRRRLATHRSRRYPERTRYGDGGSFPGRPAVRAAVPFQLLIGRGAYAEDGAWVGLVRAVLVDDVTGRPEWVCVATGILGARQRLVPVALHHLRADGAFLPFDAAAIRSAPRVELQDGQPSQEAEEALHRHYRLLDDDPDEAAADLAGMALTGQQRQSPPPNKSNTSLHCSAPTPPGSNDWPASSLPAPQRTPPRDLSLNATANPTANPTVKPTVTPGWRPAARTRSATAQRAGLSCTAPERSYAFTTSSRCAEYSSRRRGAARDCWP